MQPAPDPELLRLWREVARVRGLAAGAPPRLIELPAPELAQRALQDFAGDVPEPALRAQARLLEDLQLVPPEFALLPALEAALTDQLQAFYAAVPAAAGAPAPTIFIDRALRGRARRATLAHELVHALQDRWHALARRLRYEPESWDRRSALHALAEADALAVVERLGLGAPESTAGGASATEPNAAVPAVIGCSLAGPYLDARERVAALLEQGGFAALDAELRQPPASSHELLHGAPPAPTRLPRLLAPGPGWLRSYADVLGEQSLRCVLEQWGAAELAASWAADQLVSFERQAADALVWELELASAASAQALFELSLARLALPAPLSHRAAAHVTQWSCGASVANRLAFASYTGRRLRLASLSGVPDLGGCATLETWLVTSSRDP
jgi:hypothetical protein